MANSNANFVKYHSKSKTLIFFQFFTMIMKSMKWEFDEKVEEKISEAENAKIVMTPQVVKKDHLLIVLL